MSKKQPMACDLESAEELHREALCKIVYDIAKYLKDRRSNLRTSSALSKRKGDLVQARIAAERAVECDEAFNRLREIRTKYGEMSARQSYYHYAQEDRGVSSLISDPTPEQIAAACEEIQAKWTDVEKDRHAGAMRRVGAEIKTVRLLD